MSQRQHAFQLAAELLDDIELNHLTGEALLLKATRLARLTEDSDIRQWLSHELYGYSEDDSCRPYLDLTWRWKDREKKEAYWHGFPAIVAGIEALNTQLLNTKVGTLGGEHLLSAVQVVQAQASMIRNEIMGLSAIRGRVLRLLHDFVSREYYERALGDMAETIFESYKDSIDAELASRCAEVLQKIPSIRDRLREGDPEAISQALSTCRRMICEFADSVYPPQPTSTETTDDSANLGKDKYKNRINQYVKEKVSSTSRRKRLKQTLENLWDRICVGVHADVDAEEARALFLTTYLLLGEITLLE